MITKINMERKSCIALPEDTEFNINSVQSLNDERKIATDGIEEIIHDLKALNVNKKEIEQKEKALKQRILDFMGTEEILYNNDGKELVTYKTHVTKRLDTKKLKEKALHTYNLYLTESSIQRFLITKDN